MYVYVGLLFFFSFWFLLLNVGVRRRQTNTIEKGIAKIAVVVSYEQRRRQKEEEVRQETGCVEGKNTARERDGKCERNGFFGTWISWKCRYVAVLFDNGVEPTHFLKCFRSWIYIRFFHLSIHKPSKHILTHENRFYLRLWVLCTQYNLNLCMRSVRTDERTDEHKNIND